MKRFPFVERARSYCARLVANTCKMRHSAQTDSTGEGGGLIAAEHKEVFHAVYTPNACVYVCECPCMRV